MRAFSIRSVLVLILMLAVGLAAFKNANNTWAGIMLLLALVAAGVGVLGAIIMRGRERAWWIGFSVFGGGYLALTFLPVISTEIGPKLPTTQLLEFVHSEVVPSGRGALRASLIQYQRTRRQLLDSEQTAQGSDDPSLVPIRAKLLAEWQKIRNATSSINSSKAASLAINEYLPSGALWRSLLPGAANLEALRQVGHALFTLLAGLAGGGVAAWLHARREREDARVLMRLMECDR